ncbi:MAG: hypothetical protein HZA91_12510 [Verrucomicrobia bacterium]|nr:hypothetical protein [Verrucomicrobiota bacterium]
MRLAFSFAVALMLAMPLRADEAPPEAAQMCAAFFEQLKAGQIKPAYQELLKGSRIADQVEDVGKLQQRAEELVQGYGPVLGYELVKVQHVGKNLCQMTYLTRSERAPVAWQITFYRPAGTWRVFNVRMDDRIMELFGK